MIQVPFITLRAYCDDNGCLRSDVSDAVWDQLQDLDMGIDLITWAIRLAMTEAAHVSAPPLPLRW